MDNGHAPSLATDTQPEMLTAARSAGPQEGIDHLFLLPERVLSMDSASLRQDLAGLDFSVHLLHGGPKGNVWLCKLSYCTIVVSLSCFVAGVVHSGHVKLLEMVYSMRLRMVFL